MYFTRTNFRSMVKAVWVDRILYNDGLALQKALVEKIFQAKTAGRPIDNVLLLLEHHPVFTVGIRERLYTSEEEHRLRATGAEFCRTNRGGLITFHGPGQLVVYPIVDLAALSVAPKDEFKTKRVGVRRFVHLVEQTVIDLLKTRHALGNAGRSPDTGVWLDGGERKIAAIGLNIRRGISSHGLALNCNTDLHWFDEIVPCGIEGKSVTSLSKELSANVTVQETLRPMCESFAKNFEVDVDTTLLDGISVNEAQDVLN